MTSMFFMSFLTTGITSGAHMTTHLNLMCLLIWVITVSLMIMMFISVHMMITLILHVKALKWWWIIRPIKMMETMQKTISHCFNHIRMNKNFHESNSNLGSPTFKVILYDDLQSSHLTRSDLHDDMPLPALELEHDFVIFLSLDLAPEPSSRKYIMINLYFNLISPFYWPLFHLCLCWIVITDDEISFIWLVLCLWRPFSSFQESLKRKWEIHKFSKEERGSNKVSRAKGATIKSSTSSRLVMH